ncbi:unnamed protein product [Cuscuta campestris]|uniref:F-box domain-containing protein n=1 Tax=Cuscuta campestris TaxID=132261 RepID=A0A484KVY6_9ASTE|nr:unnamed protein product [Cuscuta campestris]
MAGADCLPEEIAMEVFHRLALLDDMVVFGAVCKSWRSVAVAALPRKIRTPFLIMLPEEEDTAAAYFGSAAWRTTGFTACGWRLKGKFYAITEWGQIVNCSIDGEGNQIITKLGARWVPCSQKYLVESCGELLVVFRLYDRKETKHRGDMVTRSFKVLRMEEEDDVAGAAKYNDDVQGKFKFVRVEDLGDKALFVGDSASFSITASTANGCRPGYKGWVNVKLLSGLLDVIFYKDEFYAIDRSGQISACTIDDQGNGIITELGLVPGWCVSPTYLLESRGELVVVCRRPQGTHHFEVVRMEEECVGAGRRRKFKFVMVESLGDKALFVGENSSLSITASAANRCRPNCIYFTYNEPCFGLKSIGSNMGVYNLGDGKVEGIDSLHSLSSSSPAHCIWCIENLIVYGLNKIKRRAAI